MLFDFENFISGALPTDELVFELARIHTVDNSRTEFRVTVGASAANNNFSSSRSFERLLDRKSIHGAMIHIVDSNDFTFEDSSSPPKALSGQTRYTIAG